MRSNVRDGSLFLKNASGEVTRLAWKAGKAGELRALPPGNYTLVGYRIVRKDDEGVNWFISAISPKGIRKLAVKPGKPLMVAIKPEIRVACKGRAGGPKAKGVLAVQGGFQGEHHSGLTIYREGKRIPLRFTISNHTGEEIETGKMGYG